ncbi:Alpha/Beta hydrolase protein [Pseudomassariella vexata]|uniref:Alpha/Beta hydrolase protein n=1 Tax=Pseudomassariella vexata TaxID=1141098 RepID=A0A1Y2E0F3_9PEZI|nr:Alpha/Beta hydrolase protein [Pseudomassariella vexata]ORY64957.1 Alpha/Beta hydrolase protein [Pseudomassariella vexata]
MPIQPFKIDIPQAKLDRLKAKLAVVDFPDELEDAGWDYGVPLVDIKRLTKYWHDEFEWRKAEVELNEMPQFTTNIKIDGFDAIDLHFVHVKSPNPGAIPLLFAHGWPGSFYEVQKLLPLLLDGGKDNPSFDVVAPSMPNYAFSSRVKQQGFGARQVAQVYHKLMVDVLGYSEFVTQGGDIGYSVTRFIGYLFPENCKASHYNCQITEAPSESHFPELYKIDQETPCTEAEIKGFERTKWFEEEGRGYWHEHATKPQTIGYSLTDSPVGLLAWIYEKLHDWTDDYPWTDYEVCKWISIYWFSTPGPMASLGIYYDSKHTTDPMRKTIGTMYLEHVKIGATKFPKELFVKPSLWNKTLGDLVLNKESDSGGHFAAHEKPDVLAGDLREMFGKNGGAYSVVKGKTGFA